jgi:hypothetical protein
MFLFSRHNNPHCYTLNRCHYTNPLITFIALDIIFETISFILKMDAVISSETSVNLYQITRRHVLEDSRLQVGPSVKLLLVLASTVIPVFRSRRNPWTKFLFSPRHTRVSKCDLHFDEGGVGLSMKAPCLLRRNFRSRVSALSWRPGHHGLRAVGFRELTSFILYSTINNALSQTPEYCRSVITPTVPKGSSLRPQSYICI